MTRPALIKSRPNRARAFGAKPIATATNRITITSILPKFVPANSADTTSNFAQINPGHCPTCRQFH